MDGDDLLSIAYYAPGITKNVRHGISAYLESDWFVFDEMKGTPSLDDVEKTIINRSLRDKLSSEAQTVIELIANSPAEIIDGYGRVSLNKVRAFLSALGVSHNRTRKAFQELKNYVRNLEE